MGTSEIGFAAVAITLVIVVVFLPILFVPVFVADLLKQFSVVVMISTLMSLLVSFTLSPWIASRIGKKEELEPTNIYNRFADLDRDSDLRSYNLVWELTELGIKS